MLTSRQNAFLSDIEFKDTPIPPGRLAYLGERLRNNLYDFILTKFLERESPEFTQADLARRIGYDPGRLSRLLGAPGNLTIDTVSDLLVGIAAEELVPSSKSLLNQEPRNYSRPEWLEAIEVKVNTSTELTDLTGITAVGSGTPNPRHASESEVEWTKNEREHA